VTAPLVTDPQARVPTGRPAPSYKFGTGVIVLTGLILIITDLLVLIMAKQSAARGGGAEIAIAFFFGPVIWFCIIVLLIGLLATALRRRPLPPKVRVLRLSMTVLALLLTLSFFIIQP
jgi:uncharacterized protein YaaW (UPF0174 family)